MCNIFYGVGISHNVDEAKALYSKYLGMPEHGPAARLCGIAVGGRTFGKLDKEIESVNNTLEIMSDPTTLKNIEEELKDVKERRIMTFEEFPNKHS